MIKQDESYPQAGSRSQLKQRAIGRGDDLTFERRSLSGYLTRNKTWIWKVPRSSAFHALFQTAFAAESEKSPWVTLFSSYESDDCKLLRLETRCRQIKRTCLHITRLDRPDSSNPRFPIQLQTAFYEVMGGVQTKETNAVYETNRLNSPVDDPAQLLSSRNATL